MAGVPSGEVRSESANTAGLLTTLSRRILFAPLDDQGRGDIVLERLRSAISLGVLAPGELLPPETELAAQLNISPVTLREALQQLRDQGLVTTRRGRGGGTVVIAPPADPRAVALEQVAELSRLDLREFADWRRALAAESARLAALRASSADVALLERGSQRLAVAEDQIVARRADSRYFIELGAASQSVRLSSYLIDLQVAYAPVLTLAYGAVVLRQRVAVLLMRSTRAVADGNQARARANAVAAVDAVALRANELHSRGWSHD